MIYDKKSEAPLKLKVSIGAFPISDGWDWKCPCGNLNCGSNTNATFFCDSCWKPLESHIESIEFRSCLNSEVMPHDVGSCFFYYFKYKSLVNNESASEFAINLYLQRFKIALDNINELH